MGQEVLNANESYRNAGRAAIASGVIGIVAYGFLRAAVTERTTWIPSDRVYILFGAHDIGVALQFLLLIAVAVGLKKLSQQTPPRISEAAFTTGVGAIVLTGLLSLLGVGNKVLCNGYYTLPQGIFGVWLIVINWRLSGSLPRWLRWSGMIVGSGLVLVGISFVGVASVYPSLLAIPAVPQENIKEVDSQANNIFHQILYIGTYIGVVTLPVWTILVGFKLPKKSRPAPNQSSLRTRTARPDSLAH